MLIGNPATEDGTTPKWIATALEHRRVSLKDNGMRKSSHSAKFQVGRLQFVMPGSLDGDASLSLSGESGRHLAKLS